MSTLNKSVKFCLILALFAGPVTFSELKAAEKREIQFYTTPPGSVIHSIGIAMCDMLKKHSPWLTGTVEVAWGVDTLKLWTRDPARKKTGVANMLPVSLWEAEGMGPFQ